MSWRPPDSSTGRRSAGEPVACRRSARRAPRLLGKLMAAVRPGVPRRRARPRAGRSRSSAGRLPGRRLSADRPHRHGLCRGHHHRWQRQAARTWRRSSPTPAADALEAADGLVPRWHGCRYGAARQGPVRGPSRSAWERAGHPELERWLAARSPTGRPPAAVPSCRGRFCDLWAQGRPPFCRQPQRSRWQRGRQPRASRSSSGSTRSRPDRLRASRSAAASPAS